jgi:SpoVK/Ycf46/Vps4 family AAA+-type ATPase
MTNKIETVKSKLQHLGTLDHQNIDCSEAHFDQFLGEVRDALQQSPLRTHKRLRMPGQAWSRISAQLKLSDATENYVLLSLPPMLRNISSAQLDDLVLGTAITELADAWLQLLIEISREYENFHIDFAFTELLAPDLQRLWIAPNDSGLDIAAYFDAGALDRDTQAMLDTLPNYLSRNEKISILVGIWGGAQISPCLPDEWIQAESWIMGSDHEISSFGDIASARAWLLSNKTPLYSTANTESIERFVAWAYRRASTWPTFISHDSLIHAKIRKIRERGDFGDELFPEWLKNAMQYGLKDKLVSALTIVAPTVTADGLMAELDALVGLEDVKQIILEIVNAVKLEREREAAGFPNTVIDMNLVLTGNPGTGKTTVARLYGQILKSLGALDSGRFVEVTKPDLVGGYLGQSNAKTRASIKQAEGGVFFLDEAYSLTLDDRDLFGKEAIAELVAGIENNRGKTAFVVAGYPQEMHKFIEANPGLKSRFRAAVNFPDLQTVALIDVLRSMIESAKYEIEAEAVTALRKYVEEMPRSKGFGNAREMRSLFSIIRGRLATRHSHGPGVIDLNLITVADIPKTGPEKVDEEQLSIELASLNSLTGLAPVKSSIFTLINQAKHALMAEDLAVDAPRFDVGHFAFMGRPGTGKTTVATSLGKMFAAMGVLKSGHVVEANRSTLIASYVGQTAPLVRKAVQEALDGVLFIDEAYALKGISNNDFGPEAIATLLEEMEKHRSRLVVVMAGYEKEMESFLESNPGFKSRVKHIVKFPDFDELELREICQSVVLSRRLKITDDALNAVALMAHEHRNSKDFANGRTVRNLVEQSAAELANRVMTLDQNQVTPEIFLTITSEDMPNAPKTGVAFGFAPIL